MFTRTLTLTTICMFIYSLGFSQEKVYQTFKDTRVINTHSVETLRARQMDIRIGHRFGDFAGDSGGWPSFYGLENAADISIGVEYGWSDNLMMGIHRTKGAGPLKQNVLGLIKYRIMQQMRGKNGFGLSVMGLSSVSTMKKSESPGFLHDFQKTSHRISYNVSLIASRKFSNRFSFQAHAGWTYRNLVPSSDFNDLVSAGFAFRLQMNKALGIIYDSNFTFSSVRSPEDNYFPAIGIGLEWETGGGHVFQINLTNAKGIFETDYIPYTQSSWGEGEYRLGFTIARLFKV